MATRCLPTPGVCTVPCEPAVERERGQHGKRIEAEGEDGGQGPLNVDSDTKIAFVIESVFL